MKKDMHLHSQHEVSSKDHSYVEPFTEHYHKMAGDSSMEYRHNIEHSKIDEVNTFIMSSFLLGTAFGFFLWVPAVTLIIYCKSCGAAQKELPQDGW